MIRFNRIILAGIAVFFLASTVYAEALKVDIYKTNQFKISDIQPLIDAAKPQLIAARQAYLKQDFQKTTSYIEPFGKKIKKEIRKRGEFAYLNLSMVIYPNDPNNYLTINVVDKDKAGTLPVFDPKPTGHYTDPGNLLKAWRRYEYIATPLYMTGKLGSSIKSCKEFHCLGLFSTPVLKKFEREFNRDVPKYENQLADILKNDANAKNRATAALLLAHTTNENQLITWMLGSINDADEGVRNNATRVLAFMALKDEKITLPVDDFIKMLHSPVLTDRNKALAVLSGLSRQKRYVEVIKAKAGPDLIDNLHLEQPNLHGSAYALLQAMSGQHYGDRDYAAWSHWLGLS